MDRRQIALKLVIDSLGLDFTIETFEKRLILQKAIYLTQAAGVNLGYYYRWYRYGPYSTSLTQDAYATVIELDRGLDELQNWTWDDECKQHLGEIKALIDLFSPAEKAKKLELLASTHFLVDREGMVVSDIPKISQVLRNYGKDFDDSEVSDAMEYLLRYKLLGS